MAARVLPTEILAGAFGYLSPSHLAVISRVCRSWKTVAFPLLYKTVYLCFANHLEEFVQRVHTEEAENRTSVVTHLKGLVLDDACPEKYETIEAADVDKLNAIIPRLTNLSFLAWNLCFVPKEPETFRLFQTECPKLRSVDLWIYGGIDFYSEEYDRLLDFKDLWYFSLSIWDTPSTFDEDQVEPLASLLIRCPQLSSIILDFDHDEWRYSPSILFATLNSMAKLDQPFVFPHLRRFYAQGCSDPEWMDFFDDPEPHPFRQFFYRHPRIEDLALGYVYESGYWKEIDPTELPPLFPSLKYFEGPAFLFKPLVLSSLAEQIEKLIVVDNRLYRDSLIELGDRTTMLPKLRKFGIWAAEVEEGVLVNTLRSVVKASNQLEDIEIHPEIDSTNYEEVFSLITQVPSLRSVTLDQSVLSTAAGDDGEELEWDAFASLLRRTCPALQSIYQSIEKRDKENRKKVWELHDNV
ncbi:unnamed protein product [Rhizoctonia solani]|uniref:F-box domain-containing protein n=1 Tax=Rhizoctonia solani TaxID=456999 RepID=A0A8H3A764_9AGAM|nr:unnamed protein product [Rhizoctonia solani]